MEDKQIIALYWRRCPDAIVRSNEKYGHTVSPLRIISCKAERIPKSV